MAAVSVPREDFARGEFPPVCARTGQPTDATAAIEGSRLPGWTFLLLLFGVLPFLVAWVFARERIAGRVPITPEASARHRRLARASDRALLLAGLWLAASAAVGLTLGLPDGAGPLVVAGFVALLVIAAGYGLAAALRGVRAQPDASGAAVRISGAHPQFVTAVRSAPRQAEPR